MNIKKLYPEERFLVKLNHFIHSNNDMFEYHMSHIFLVRKYAFLINKKLGYNIDKSKLSYIALAHDLFKERSLDPSKESVIWNNLNIPQNTRRYVRLNLDDLEEFGLDEYFNTDIQYHPLTSGLFLKNELGINDPEILYPIFFHSCPIIDIYKTLSNTIQNMVDIIMLSDKLSSNYLRINLRNSNVRIDLDQAVFGSNGKEFNYTLGLFLARIIGQGKSIEKQSQIATKYYYKRLSEMNPLIPKEYSVKILGGNKKWEKRKSQAWKKQ